VTDSRRTDAALANRLVSDLKAGGQARTAAIATLQKRGTVRCLSFQAAGCRAVQLALDLADRRTAAELAVGLRGSVASAIRSPHGNYVVQKIIGVLTPCEVPFLVEEIAEAKVDLARHKYGCRVFCRLLEQYAGDERTRILVDSVLVEADKLAVHAFGHHVVECVLEHGLPHQRQWIISALSSNLQQTALNRSGAYVLEKALLMSSGREMLAQGLLALPPEVVAAIATDQYGSRIMRAIEQMSEDMSQRLRACLSLPTVAARLHTSKYGRRFRDLGSCLAMSATANNASGPIFSEGTQPPQGLQY